MEIRLLAKGYRDNEELYHDFLNGTVDDNKKYFSNEYVEIQDAPNFPIYMGKGSEEIKKEHFLKAFQTIENYYINLDREITFNGSFWHSLLITKKREYILEFYPQIKESFQKFRNVVTKNFDWENYIYKCLIGSQYICDHTKSREERLRYYEIIINNLDVYNYLIKYGISRNRTLIINILDIIDELNLSQLLKMKIKGREDLGDDERYGRRVIFEFNKSYPIIMGPMLEKSQLKQLFLEYLSYYYDLKMFKNE